MLIKNIFMELRTRLRSCNVYITTTTDFTDNCNFKINIQPNSITLNYTNDERSTRSRRSSASSVESLSDCFSDEECAEVEVISIDEFCQLIPNSMSGLKIDKNNISFRILTEPKTGNFYKELIANSNSDYKIKNSINMIINITIQDDVKILCTNCSNLISEGTIKFDRILELPSENIDMSDWFCHNHGGTSSADTIVLKSNKYDLLHRLSFILVNFCLLSQKTNSFNLKRNVYHCNRCLAWLGVKNKDSVKLFNSTIKVLKNEKELNIFKNKNQSISKDIILNDFIYTIECMTKEFNLGFQYTIMCKLVLECTISNMDKNFLLVWVMDKELQVLRNSEVAHDSDKIKLLSSFLTKILYKIELSLNEEVETWISDPSIICTEISKNMFYSGIDHLKKMSLKVPESFRMTNGYFVSYLNV